VGFDSTGPLSHALDANQAHGSEEDRWKILRGCLAAWGAPLHDIKVGQPEERDKYVVELEYMTGLGSTGHSALVTIPSTDHAGFRMKALCA
jgi:hypothetical protein